MDERCNPCHDGCGCVQDELSALHRRVGELEAWGNGLHDALHKAVAEYKLMDAGRETWKQRAEQAEQRLASIDASAKADADDLAKMRDGSKLTRAGLVEVIKYQQDDLKQAEQDRDRLRAVIADAPHAYGCAAFYEDDPDDPGYYRERQLLPPNYLPHYADCDCWKSGVKP